MSAKKFLPYKIDPYSRILLATQTINYIGNAINEIRLQCAFSDGAMMLKLREEKEAALNEYAAAISEIAESMADAMNHWDAVTEEDSSVLSPALRLLNPRIDEIEKLGAKQGGKR